MATLKIIDGRDKFVFEVDGHKIPNVIDYEIIRGNNSPAYLKLTVLLGNFETVGAAEEEGYIFDNNT